MTGDVPDMPDDLQSRTPFVVPDPAVDPNEWYADMVPVPEGLTSKPKVSEMISGAGSAVSSAVDNVVASVAVSSAAPTVASEGKTAAEAETKKVGGAVAAAPSSDGPDPALFERYYPADIRNLAPNISVSKDADMVSMNMAPVESAFYERFYPKESLNKAPVIDIFYSGSLNTASVSLKMDEVEGLPALAIVPKGDVQTNLVPSAGGGLKLNFSVSGGDSLNAYSDPRGVDKFNAMVRGAASAPAPQAPASVQTQVKKAGVQAAAPVKKAAKSVQ